MPSVERLEIRRLLAVGTVSEQIIVDQFGWRADAPRKVAIFADPINGQNAAISYTPGATFQVLRAGTDAVAFSGSTVVWNGGATDAVSGDKVWQGDFSSLTAPGEYYIYDSTNNLRSYNFILNSDVFDDVLTASMRMFYYQRQGTAIPAQYGGNWTHALDHTNDLSARLWNGAPVNGTNRDVSGGWYDAGDYNKYVVFTTGPLWDLLSAYEWNPSAFSDRTNIPESGNGVPDALDEIKWELNWLLKMQNGDGSVLNRVANATYDSGNADPATDTQARYYTAATTWATASFAASLAHASRVIQPFDASYAATLLTAATNAWNYLAAHPSMLPASGNDGGGSGGGAGSLAAAAADSNAGADLRLRILAAAELFKTTGTAAYKTFFDANYNSSAAAENGFQPMLQNPKYLDASLCLDLNHAYMTYATAAGATTAVVNNIKSAVQGVDQSWLALGQYLANSDPYRSFMWTGHYTWGSNQLKAEWAKLLLFAYKLNVTPANSAKYLEAAEEYLHYFHGRNPLSYVYLSNMGAKGADAGADKSPLEIYHSWYADGSSKYDGASSLYGPAPGYVVGGPNQNYSGGVTPPTGEPPMKAFRDFNDGWPYNSWEITEPAIYDQAAYTLLLSQFATAPLPAWLQYKGGGAAHFTGAIGAQTLHVTGGTVVLNALAWTDRPNLALSVENGAAVKLTSTQKFSSLSFATNGRIDLADNDMIVTAMTRSAVESLVKAGFGANKDWAGTGITSSLAAANVASGGATAVGVLDNALLGKTTFSGQSVSTTDILVKYTWTGDTNLDGVVNTTDFTNFLAGYNNGNGPAAATPPMWLYGDLNFDGVVNTTDFTLFLAGYNASNSSGVVLQLPQETTASPKTTTQRVQPPTRSAAQPRKTSLAAALFAEAG